MPRGPASLSVPIAKRRLSVQVADSLRAAIADGVWKQELPAERLLCEKLAVSRSVLREALHLLREEGLLRIVPRYPTQIIRRKTGTGSRKLRRICLLSFESYEEFSLSVMDELRRRLHLFDHELEFVYDRRLLHRKQPDRLLSSLAAHYEGDLWILSSVSAPVQSWFQQRNIPTVILGDVFPGIRLPSVDYNIAAMARHAAGALLGLGHRHIVFFTRQGDKAGDIIMEQVFRETLEVSRSRIAYRTVRHTGSVDEIRSQIRRLMTEPAQRPTALFINHSADVLPVFSTLLLQQVRIPEEISLLARTVRPHIYRMVPRPSHYRFDAQEMAAKLVQLIESPSSGGGRIRILNSLDKGATLAPPPRAGFGQGSRTGLQNIPDRYG